MTANRTSSNGREPISQEDVISFLAARTTSELSSWLDYSPQEVGRGIQEVKQQSGEVPIDSLRSQEAASQGAKNRQLAGLIWSSLSDKQKRNLRALLAPLLPPDQSQDLWSLLDSAAPSSP